MDLVQIDLEETSITVFQECLTTDMGREAWLSWVRHWTQCTRYLTELLRVTLIFFSPINPVIVHSGIGSDVRVTGQAAVESANWRCCCSYYKRQSKQAAQIHRTPLNSTAGANDSAYSSQMEEAWPWQTSPGTAAQPASSWVVVVEVVQAVRATSVNITMFYRETPVTVHSHVT